MAKQAINTLKGWFVTGDEPVQQQFWDWLDSFRHLDTPIGIDDLSADLKTAINGIITPVKVIVLPAGTATYQMPGQSCLQAVLMFDAGNPSISVGVSNGGTEVYDAQQLANGVAVSAGWYPFAALTTIYFNNITANTVLKIVYI